MWQLINGGQCRNLSGFCDYTSFYNWVQAISNYIRSLDANHLISLGINGTDECGAQAYQLNNLNTLYNIDLVSAVDFNDPIQLIPNGVNQKSNLFINVIYIDKFGSQNNISSLYQPIKNNWNLIMGSLQIDNNFNNSIGINMEIENYPSFNATVYINQLNIGGTSFLFENNNLSDFEISGTLINNISIFNHLTYGNVLALDLNIPGNGYLFIKYNNNNNNSFIDINFQLFIPLEFPPINTIFSDMSMALQINKPFFIEASGIAVECNGELCITESERATILSSKINATFCNGGIGYMIWSYLPQTFSNPSPYDFSSNDPLYSAIQKLSLEIQNNSCIYEKTIISSNSPSISIYLFLIIMNILFFK